MKKQIFLTLLLLFGGTISTFASDLDIAIPDLHGARFTYFFNLLVYDALHYSSYIILATLGFSLLLRRQVYLYPVHEAMAEVAETIYKTCKTYLIQQGKLLAILFVIMGSFVAFYYKLGNESNLLPLILLYFFIGVTGPYIVAWYGIRLNTYANSRTAFASLQGPLQTARIPLKAGMSAGLFLISLELIIMVSILLLVPGESAGACFLVFAIGESMSASVLRVAGGIFTKIADIGSDLMKIVFKIREDDPRNPGVIADCVGDNAGDSVGPTADAFETYGVTGVALISFLILSLPLHPVLIITLIGWLIMLRYFKDVSSAVSFFVNDFISIFKYRNAKTIDFEEPLTRLVRISAINCIIICYSLSYFLLGHLGEYYLNSNLLGHFFWFKCATLVSFGTLGSVFLPEFTKIFTSTKSKHVQEIISASRQGGASLNILSGMVAGNFSAFWKGMLIIALMTPAYAISVSTGFREIPYAFIFACGLEAFGLLCMGPINIAVDFYGPVTDNAQSIFELSQIEKIKNIVQDILSKFGFKPDFEMAKFHLESNDEAGNTFKATAKPVLIATAVIGATTMIFSTILILKNLGILKAEITHGPFLLGLIAGPMVAYWFTGASIQSVVTGAYKAIVFIKKKINLNKSYADIKDSKAVVKICTIMAQAGMLKIIGGIFCFTLGFAFVDPNFFIGYLISLSIASLFLAMYMANAGGAWDNSKKYVEVDLKEKNTPLHEATIVGDTVGDPYKDTSSVALNPILKFSSLFGMLAVEMAIKMSLIKSMTYVIPILAVVFIGIALFFVYASFYKSRITNLIEEDQNEISTTATISVQKNVFAGK